MQRGGVNQADILASPRAFPRLFLSHPSLDLLTVAILGSGLLDKSTSSDLGSILLIGGILLSVFSGVITALALVHARAPVPLAGFPRGMPLPARMVLVHALAQSLLHVTLAGASAIALLLKGGTGLYLAASIPMLVLACAACIRAVSVELLRRHGRPHAKQLRLLN
jgi:hypothetical protein